MADNQTGSTAPPTNSSPQYKAQPWRAFWPLVGENSARAFPEIKSVGSENAAKYWYTLERGVLIAEQEKELAVVMQKKFDGKPWYAGNKEDWDGLNPMDMARRLDRCSNCGQPSENC
ncbi:hypothetical protein VE02_09367 [Pseudogymnoascus sp. 03VT05]|nr:hypothetical protein VE02_09367 [Pseudogymnoascus sp. 03VT05]